jgi:hypothetical protein
MWQRVKQEHMASSLHFDHIEVMMVNVLGEIMHMSSAFGDHG